ncbi:hypothetical protein KST_00151 [Mycobacterium marinum]|nr:hypothetical protein KST_00151 [Mycobacterium marinum]
MIRCQRAPGILKIGYSTSSAIIPAPHREAVGAVAAAAGLLLMFGMAVQGVLSRTVRDSAALYDAIIGAPAGR